jgi:hypothetical protein
MTCHEQERLRHLALSSVVRLRSDVVRAVWRVLGQPESRVYHLGRGGPRWKESGVIAALCGHNIRLEMRLEMRITL